MRKSLINTFATLMMLSYLKLGYVALYILTSTRIWRPDDSHKWAVYYEPSMKFFGSSHVIFAATFVVIGFFLLIMPVVVLFLYPCRWFQKCLNHFDLRSLALQAFVDVFQGCYKDGTNGTRDCRYFAPLLISLRLMSLLLFSLSRDSFMFFFFFTIIFGCYGVLFAIAQPYKQAVYNKTDIVLIFVLVLFGVSDLYTSSSQEYPMLPYILWTVISYIIIVFYIFYWAAKQFVLFCCRPRYSIHI